MALFSHFLFPIDNLLSDHRDPLLLRNGNDRMVLPIRSSVLKQVRRWRQTSDKFLSVLPNHDRHDPISARADQLAYILKSTERSNESVHLCSFTRQILGFSYPRTRVRGLGLVVVNLEIKLHLRSGRAFRPFLSLFHRKLGKKAYGYR